MCSLNFIAGFLVAVMLSGRLIAAQANPTTAVTCPLHLGDDTILNAATGACDGIGNIGCAVKYSSSVPLKSFFSAALMRCIAAAVCSDQAQVLDVSRNLCVTPTVPPTPPQTPAPSVPLTASPATPPVNLSLTRCAGHGQWNTTLNGCTCNNGFVSDYSNVSNGNPFGLSGFVFCSIEDRSIPAQGSVTSSGGLPSLATIIFLVRSGNPLVISLLLIAVAVLCGSCVWVCRRWGLCCFGGPTKSRRRHRRRSTLSRDLHHHVRNEPVDSHCRSVARTSAMDGAAININIAVAAAPLQHQQHDGEEQPQEGYRLGQRRVSLSGLPFSREQKEDRYSARTSDDDESDSFSLPMPRRLFNRRLAEAEHHQPATARGVCENQNDPREEGGGEREEIYAVWADTAPPGSSGDEEYFCSEGCDNGEVMSIDDAVFTVEVGCFNEDPEAPHRHPPTLDKRGGGSSAEECQMQGDDDKTLFESRSSCGG